MKKRNVLKILPLLLLAPLVFTSCNSTTESDNEHEKPQEPVEEKAFVTIDSNIKNGTIEVEGIESGNSVKVGTIVKVKVLPSPDYELDKVYVNGIDITDTLQFVANEKGLNYFVTATFKAKTKYGSFSITGELAEFVQVLGGLKQNEPYKVGTVVEIEIPESEDYVVEGIFVNDKNITAIKKFTIENDIEYVIRVDGHKVIKKARIIIDQVLHGKVTMVGYESGDLIPYNEEVHFVVDAHPGYLLESLKVNDKDITSSLTFIIPEVSLAEYHVKALFSEKPLVPEYATLTLPEKHADNGFVSYKDYFPGEKVLVGTTVDLVYDALPGYRLEKILLDNNIDITNKKSFEVSKANGEHIVTGTFVKIPDSELAEININAAINGRAYVNYFGTTAKVEIGKPIKFTIDPNEGYELNSFIVDGIDITSDLVFTPSENKIYNCDVTFKARDNKTSGTENIDGIEYNYTNGYQVTKLKDDKYLGQQRTISSSEKENFYNENYTRATTYNEAISRAEAGLLSGDIKTPSAVSNYNNVKNPANNTGTRFMNATTRYIVNDMDEPIGYIINDLDNDDTNDLVIYKGAAYASMDEVSAYLFAFNELPVNWKANKNTGDEKFKAKWGEFGRVNDSVFSGNPKQYPYQSILTGNNVTFEYHESDFGSDGNFLFFLYKMKGIGKQDPYNDGNKINRGVCRMLFTRKKYSGYIQPGEERHVFYTNTHYNTFQEYLNYRGGYNYTIGSLVTGNKYNGSKNELKNEVIQPLPYNLATW